MNDTVPLRGAPDARFVTIVRGTVSFLVVTAIALGTLSGVVPAESQVLPPARLSLGAGPVVQGYRFDAPDVAGVESVSLVAVPFQLRVPVGGRATLQLRGGFARGSLVDAGGSETTLAGLVDTEVSLGLGFGSGPLSASISGVLMAPTGNARHSPEEAKLAALMASELLPFRMTSWGAGGAAGVTLTAARSFGDGSIGFGAGYISAREFEPFQSDARVSDVIYRPGDQLQIRLAADRNVTRSSKLSVAMVFERSAEDQLEGQNLYRAGNRYQAMGSYAFTAGARSTAIVYAGGLRSDQGTALDPGLAHDFSSRTLLLAGGGMRVPMGGVVLVPSVDARLFRRGSGADQGYVGGAGAALEIPVENFVITPAGRIRFGSLVVEEGSASRITGFEAGLEIRFGP